MNGIDIFKRPDKHVDRFVISKNVVYFRRKYYKGSNDKPKDTVRFIRGNINYFVKHGECFVCLNDNIRCP